MVFQNFNAKLTLFINNNACSKMVDSTTLSLHRSIKVTGKTTQGVPKEFEDNQVIMKAKFRSAVASKEPNVISQDFAIKLCVDKQASTEQNRFLMLHDFDDGSDMPIELKSMQHEFLPTVNSDLIKIDYHLECVVSHEGLLNIKQEVPSLNWPINVTVDPKGPIEHPATY